MSKVATSHGGQTEHQAPMCARVNGRGADNPVICSVAPVQVPGGKQKCQAGWHVALLIVLIGKQNVHSKFGPCTKHLEHVMRGYDSNITQHVNRHFGSLTAAAGTVRAKESNGKRDGICVDDTDKGGKTRDMRLGKPTWVSRVNTRGMPQEWSQTWSHDVPWPHVRASHGLDNVAAIGRHNTKPRWGKKP